MSLSGEWNNCIVGNCDVSPEFFKGTDFFGIKLKDLYYSAGKWKLKVKRDKAYSLIKASLEYEINSENESKIFCTLIQYDKMGNEICGDYFCKDEKNYSISLELQGNTDFIIFEFLFYSFGPSKVKLSYPDIQFGEDKSHRIVNVATTCFKRKFTCDCNDNLEEILKILDDASKDEIKPDIICFTETAYDRGIVNCENQKWISENSEPVKKVLKKAKEVKMYVLFGIHEIDNGRKYNTVLLISPDGEIIGKYRKTHLTYKELSDGIIPGDELKVFDLPFGKVGILICWDQWFPDTARVLVKKGAEIIFVSTAGDPECIYRARAYENGVHLVVSGTTNDDNMRSFILDQKGDVISKVPDGENGYTVSQIDLDEHKYLKYLCFENGYGNNLYKEDRRECIYAFRKE